MVGNIFIKNLKQLNRKERFFLIGQALGNQEFKLGDDFSSQLKREVSLQDKAGECQFAAMDYHFDWVYSALFLAAKGKCIGENKVIGDKWTRDENSLLITGTQQDVDLIAVFQEKQYSHLVMLEAKGYGGWDIKQLNEKGKRVSAIFDDKKLLNQAKVQPHFVYVAPKKPTEKQCQAAKLPELMKNAGYIKLELPCVEYKPTRCTPSIHNVCDGTKDKVFYKQWHINTKNHNFVS